MTPGFLGAAIVVTCILGVLIRLGMAVVVGLVVQTNRVVRLVRPAVDPLPAWVG